MLFELGKKSENDSDSIEELMLMLMIGGNELMFQQEKCATCSYSK